MPPNPAVSVIPVPISRAPSHRHPPGAYSLRRHGLYLCCCCEGYTPFQSIGSRRVRGGGRHDCYNGTTLRLAALSIRTYDDCVFNASRKREPGDPNDLARWKYGSRTRLDIEQFPLPSLFTCENLYFHPSKLSAPLSILTIALPSLRNVKRFGRSLQSIL